MTLAYEKASDRETAVGSPVSVITWSFTSDAAGDASEETEKVSGAFKRVATNPDNTDTPTAGWDLTIEDEDGVDLLDGDGANRDAGGTGASEHIIICISPRIASTLTFKVANAGNAKKGVVKAYIV